MKVPCAVLISAFLVISSGWFNNSQVIAPYYDHYGILFMCYECGTSGPFRDMHNYQQYVRLDGELELTLLKPMSVFPMTLI